MASKQAVFTNSATIPLAGLLALAVAMGIGRFAFTPILPMMQADQGLSLSFGAIIASANYLGYLVGALIMGRSKKPPASMLRGGLWLVVFTTAAMGVDHSAPGWLLWRFLAGMASALALVSTAAICLERLKNEGRAWLSGVVFSGVGCGICIAGIASMALNLQQASSSSAWFWMALMALLGLWGAAPLWRKPAPETAAAAKRAEPASGSMAPSKRDGLHWGLILCYGMYGFGYILPATFLPAQARELINDPWLFSLAWPIFGVAGALSTVLAARVLRGAINRPQAWAAVQLVMACGVLLPVFWQGLGAIILAAICVGSTFMVITMVGLQEGVASVSSAWATRQMSAMTASFAIGQLIGPMFFSLTHDLLGAPLELALLLGGAGLAAGAVPIWRLQRSPPASGMV